MIRWKVWSVSESKKKDHKREPWPNLPKHKASLQVGWLPSQGIWALCGYYFYLDTYIRVAMAWLPLLGYV